MEKRFHCGHCGEKVSKTLYYQHKRLYYSSATNSWSRSAYHDHPGEPPSSGQVEGEEFTFSESEEERG